MTALETKADAEALINKEGIEYVSVRFTDLIGVQQHFTVPASEFLKDAFTDGMPFDGSSVEGFQAINESDMKLVPDVSTGPRRHPAEAKASSVAGSRPTILAISIRARAMSLRASGSATAAAWS